jgi:hypothetical protein
MPARAGREICGRAAVAWQCQNAGTLYLHGAPNMAVSSSLGLRGVWWTVNPFKGCVVEVPCKVGAKGEQWAACRRWVPWLCSYTGRGLASLRSYTLGTYRTGRVPRGPFGSCAPHPTPAQPCLDKYRCTPIWSTRGCRTHPTLNRTATPRKVFGRLGGQAATGPAGPQRPQELHQKHQWDVVPRSRSEAYAWGQTEAGGPSSSVRPWSPQHLAIPSGGCSVKGSLRTLTAPRRCPPPDSSFFLDGGSTLPPPLVSFRDCPGKHLSQMS